MAADGSSSAGDSSGDAPRAVAADEVMVAYGDACATVTPRIRETMVRVGSGGVLEVRTDDPTAREGVPAWARLTGNTLVGVVHDDDQRTRFYIRKK